MLIITLLFRSTGTVNCTIRLSCDYQNDNFVLLNLHVTLTELVSPPSFLPSSLPPFLPSFLPSSLPSLIHSSLPPFLPSFLPSPFLPPFLPSFFPSFLPCILPPLSLLPSILPVQICCSVRNSLSARVAGSEQDSLWVQCSVEEFHAENQGLSINQGGPFFPTRTGDVHVPVYMRVWNKAYVSALTFCSLEKKALHKNYPWWWWWWWWWWYFIVPFFFALV